MDASLFSHIPSLSGIHAPVIEHEFQAVCLECEEWFGKNRLIWMQPHKVGVTNSLLRYALKQTQQRGIRDIRYFIAIINGKTKESKNS